MNWEKLFNYLNRFNAVVLALCVIVLGGFLVFQYFQTLNYERDWHSNLNDNEFGSEASRTNSIIGHPVDTTGGKIVAYYESDDDFERKELAGLILVNLANNETLPIATANTELLVDFEFLFDQGDEKKQVVGYIARIASEDGYKQGVSNLIVGALPAMTKNEIANGVRFVDTPTVRSDGYLALIMWQDEERGEVVAIDLKDGRIVDRTQIKVPIIDPERISQGPGKSFDPGLLRQPDYGAAPTGLKAF